MSRLFNWLAFALYLGLLPAAAAQSPVLAAIDVHPLVPDVGTALRIDVNGYWPDACAPQIASARIDGFDIVLLAQLPSSCSGDAREFSTSTERLPPAALKLSANGIYRIRFEVQRGKGRPELHGFRLLYAGNHPGPGFVPETGFWWPETGGEFDNAGPGLGVQMEAQGNTLSIGTFGYDPDGRSGWYIGAGSIEGRIAQMELSRLQNGAGPFVSYQAPKSIENVGSVHIELLSPSRATLWFLRQDAGGKGWQTQPVSMVRFRFAQDPALAWLGRWVVLAESDNEFITRRIEFTAFERGESGFALIDEQQQVRLECELDSDRPNSPPSRCQLLQSGEGHVDVEFDAVALNEMRGWTGDGSRIVSLKLNR